MSSGSAARPARVVFFGTYEKSRVARIEVLQQGLRDRGWDVVECQRSLGLSPDQRVAILRDPRRIPTFLGRLAAAWSSLFRASRQMAMPDAVVVPYMGHFDVHLARWCFPRTPIVLDHLVFADETAADRRGSRRVVRLLGLVDRAALRAADLIVVDTDDHRSLVPPELRGRAVVVPVGAPCEWFNEPALPSSHRRGSVPRDSGGALKVVFFGLFTPLQGVPTIARAARLLEDGTPIEFSLIGDGQDSDEVDAILDGAAHVERIAWLDASRLANHVATCDVALGIFGTSAKARRVVPQKLFLSAARGLALVTSDTTPQRRAFGEAACLVPAGEPSALAAALRALQGDPERVDRLRAAAAEVANRDFRPFTVVAPLVDRLAPRRGGR